MFTLLKRESRYIPVILIVLLIGCWSELDLYAPSFPQMMHFFGTTEQMMQWTLSLNFLGFFFASLLCGPLADAFGRRIVILSGTLLFVVGSALCVYAPSIEWMLFGRFVQGIGVSAPVTVCMAVIADIYQGEAQMKLLSKMNSSITITMALAPIAGVYLTEQFGWRSNFIVILAVALIGIGLIWLFVPETHDDHLRTKFSGKSLVQGYMTLLKSKDFMYSTLGMCFSITPYFVLIGIMPLLYMEKLGISLNHYALYQGSVVGLFSVLSLMVPMLMTYFDTEKIVRYSTILAVVALVAVCLISMIIPDNPLIITACMWFYIVGIVMPPTFLFAAAMDMFPELRACASSLIQSVRMLSMSVGTAIAGAFYNGTFMPVALVLLAFMLLSVPMIVLIMRRKAGVAFRIDTAGGMH